MEQHFHLDEILNQPKPESLFQLPSWACILEPAQKIHIPKGSFILRESEQCSNFMWLLKGTVRVYKHSTTGREITLYRVKPGELCVLSLQSLLSGNGFPAVAIAETDLVGLALNKHEFDCAMDDSKSFRNYLLKDLSQRLSDVVQLVSDVTFQRLELRLCCLLGQRFKQSDNNELQVTHSELAHELGTTREMISRILKELEHKQCIRLARGFIYLDSEDMLNWLSNN